MKIPRAINTQSAILGLTLLMGCVTEPDRIQPFPELPEDRGTLVGRTYVNSNAEPTWAGNDSVVYQHYDPPQNAPGTYSIRIADIAGQGSRELYAHVVRDEQYGQIAATADGSVVYFRRSAGLDSVELWAQLRSEATPRLITSRGGIFTVELQHVIPTPDGAAAAFTVRPDSLFVYDVASGAKRFVAFPCRQIGAISSDGTRVVCGNPGGARASLSIVNLNDGSTTPVTGSQDVLGWFRLVRFGPAGLQLFYERYPEKGVADLAAGTQSVVLRDSLATLYTGIGFRFGWSPDGTRIAYWRWQCLTAGFGCTVQYLLEEVDVRTTAIRRVAVVRASSEEPGTPVYSPDGTKLAFRAGASVYVKAVH
jgi:hypothetical protein